MIQYYGEDYAFDRDIEPMPTQVACGVCGEWVREWEEVVVEVDENPYICVPCNRELAEAGVA